jgi:4-alpha-glucanotransferase
MRFDRQSGVFMHVTSLPGPHGVGDLGDGAREFVDFLDRADQSLWQVCPLGPTSSAHGDSPYQSFSAFAGNPLLVSLDRLHEQGWLTDDDLAAAPDFDRHSVEYDRVRSFKQDALRTAARRFDETASESEQAEFAEFREAQASWLDGYALFMALKAHFDGDLWTNWPEDVKTRDPDTLAEYREELADEIHYREFCQFVFSRQWQDVKQYANDHGVQVVGDLPIYVALDSADVWSAPEAFQLDEHNEPTAVAGVPPNDADSGQRWGNPLYDWDHLAETGYDWWMDRLSRLFEQVDVTRIDHFRGFDRYWAIPAESQSPADGEWREGPQDDFFETVEAEFGDLPFVAEDLGFVDEGLVRLRDGFDFPGMKVPHYADWCADYNEHQPQHFPENSVAYTSTHDTNTIVGYYEHLDDRQLDCLHYNLGVDGSRINWSMVEAVWKSDAVIALTTMQDVLGLDSHARFNTPGTAEGNWRWRVTSEGLHEDAADELSYLTELHLR